MALTRCPLRLGAGGLETGWHELGAFDDLVGSWAVPGTGDCSVEVQCRLAGRETGWYVLGERRDGSWSSRPDQRDGDGRVDVDTLRTARPCEAFRLRVVGGDGGAGARLAAVTALHPLPGPLLAPGPAGAHRELRLEPLSQMAFAGIEPELDGGGASWCSPTCLAMVLRFHGIDVEVPAVARAVYDPSYGGCGNWSLNVAFAGACGLDAVVTRLRSLADAAVLIEAGMPPVASLAAAPGALTGFPLAAGTTGHLVVVTGFDREGNPVVLDPAAPEASSVRRVYPAAAFADAWLGGSGGIVYVIRPVGLRLPPSDGLW
jgi:hypothetical protein